MNLERVWRKGNPPTLVEMYISESIMKNIMEVP